MTCTPLISERAEADLRVIWRWTCETFGEARADNYLDDLNNGMRTCAAAPRNGKDRSELRSGYRSVLVGRHVVFYTCADERVIIQRVLHASMDFDNHLPK